MSDDTFYPPLEVYKNLPKILEYRKLELSNGSFMSKARKAMAKQVKQVQPWLTDAKFMELIQWERFCIVEARDAVGKDRRYPKGPHYISTIKTKTYFIILDKDYEINSADLAKILNRMPDIQSNTRKFNIDCIVISEDDLTVHPKKKLDQYEFGGSDTAGYVSVSNQLHTLFMHDLFKRVGMPKFRIVPRDEEEKILADILLNKNNIEKKSAKDPEMIILGAIAGDFIEILAFNENTAQAVRYGLVR
jgi:DNA-directed RNA polymerase subunit H (RpoH/RPB5)